MSRGVHVVLAGFMATGKSEVGRRLAARLRRPFVDTDRLVEERTGRSVRDIFATDGEARFRALERQAVADACAGPAAVIAIGGGALLDATNRDRLLGSGLVVGLTATPRAILARVGDAATRPLLADAADDGERLARIERLLAERAPLYASLPHTVDTTDASIDDVVARVAELAASV